MRYLTFAALALGMAAWAFYAALYAAIRLTGPVTVYTDGRVLGSLGPWPWLRFVEGWLEPFVLALLLGVLALALGHLLRTWPRGLWPDRSGN